MQKLGRIMKHGSAAGRRGNTDKKNPRKIGEVSKDGAEVDLSIEVPPSVDTAASPSPTNSVEKDSPGALGGALRLKSSKKKPLPPLLIYIEAGNFHRAAERARRYPREVKTWASIPIKPSSRPAGVPGNDQRLDPMKRLPLHHACFKVSARDEN